MEEKRHCFFCNGPVNAGRGNCFNIFKTVVHPLERRAAELIADVLDINVTEGEVHSDVICHKCFKLVNEFADLESRAGEIRTDMLQYYHATQKAIERASGDDEDESEVQEILEEEEDEELEEEDGGEMTLDAAKLNKLVAEAGGGRLQNIVIKNNDGTLERPTVLMVKEGNYEEVSWDDFLEVDDDDDELQEEDDQSFQILDVVDNTHICKLCPQGDGDTAFSVDGSINMNLMVLHLKHEHNVELHACELCGVGFKERSHLVSHLDTHVNDDPETSPKEMECDVCHRAFNNSRLFRIHRRQHNAHPKGWGCGLCTKKYSSRNLLEEHMNSHLGVKPYSCDICGKAYSSKYTYKAHLKTHEERERKYSCEVCKKAFMTQQNLLQHTKTHSYIRKFICKNCGKGFATLRSLEVHNIVHSGYKPYNCDICGKSFARKAEIKDHERIHTGERPFQCEHCGAQFRQRSNLQSHKRVTHFNDRRYQCGDCGKGFKRRRLLDYHIKAVHTGERPYACSTCDATFVYPEHYKKHMRIHTGIKPYKCEVCEKAFNSRDNRNAHRFVHSVKKPYECLVCGLGFMRKPLLYNHMQQAGHVNDTIVVNQPRLDKDELSNPATTDQEGDYELTIVDNDNMRNLMKKQKVYLTEKSDHVIIQGNEKTLFAKLDDGNIKALTAEDGNKRLVDEDGNFVDLDGNIISIDHLEEEESTVTAHINEKGQLVNEDGQIISEDAHALLVDESLEEGEIMVKTEVESEAQDAQDVQYVQIQISDNSRNWLNMVKSEESA